MKRPHYILLCRITRGEGGCFYIMLIVKKKAGTSDDAMIREFTRKVVDEGILMEVKRRQFHLKPSAARAQKAQDKRKAKLLKRKASTRV